MEVGVDRLLAEGAGAVETRWGGGGGLGGGAGWRCLNRSVSFFFLL